MCLFGCQYPQILLNSDSLDFSDYKMSEELKLSYDSLSQTGVIYKRETYDSNDTDYSLYLYENGKVEVFNNCLGKDLEPCKEVDGLYAFTDSSNVSFEVYYFRNNHFYEWEGKLEGDNLIIYRIHYRNQIGWKKTKITYQKYSTF